jgi:hypothetical protein
MFSGGKPARGRRRILTHSEKKIKTKKDVLTNYSKITFNIGHQHDRWVEL